VLPVALATSPTAPVPDAEDGNLDAARDLLRRGRKVLGVVAEELTPVLNEAMPAIHEQLDAARTAVRREVAEAAAGGAAAVEAAIPQVEARVEEMTAIAIRAIAAAVEDFVRAVAPLLEQQGSNAQEALDAYLARLTAQAGDAGTAAIERGQQLVLRRLQQPDAIAVGFMVAPLFLNYPIQAWAQMLQVSPRSVTLALVTAVAGELYRRGLLSEVFRDQPEYAIAVAVVVVGLVVF
jgi:hypothetical protein